MAFLIFSMALSRGSTPETAKKQVCSTLLVWLPRPAARATLLASITHTDMPCATMRS